MTTALTLSPVDTLSREAWKLARYLRKHAAHDGTLQPFRVESWVEKADVYAAAICELLDASVLRIDGDGYTIELDGRQS